MKTPFKISSLALMFCLSCQLTDNNPYTKTEFSLANSTQDTVSIHFFRSPEKFEAVDSPFGEYITCYPSQTISLRMQEVSRLSGVAILSLLDSVQIFVNNEYLRTDSLKTSVFNSENIDTFFDISLYEHYECGDNCEGILLNTIALLNLEEVLQPIVFTPSDQRKAHGAHSSEVRGLARF